MPPPSLAQNRIDSLAPRDEGVLAGGTAGVDELTADGARVTHWDSGRVRSIRPRGDDAVVVATSAGATVIAIDQSGARRPRRVPYVGEDVLDSAWLAGDAAYATARGITVFGADGVERDLLDGERAATLAFGPRGRLYAGSDRGLAMLAQSSTPSTVERVLDGHRVTALASAPEGMYVGTLDTVYLATIDGPPHPVARETLSVSPGALVLDGERVYAGATSGLWVFDRTPRTWHRFAPLGEIEVTAVAVSASSIWVGTANGLVKLPRTAVDASAAPRS
jgi:ligand-binding sensor domain-containing protein